MTIEKSNIDRTAADGSRAFRAVGKSLTDQQRADRTITVTASGMAVDRDGEIVHPGGWSNREAFLASNAPFKTSHLATLASGEPPQIGWVMDMARQNNDLVGQVRFSNTNVAEEWWKLASDPKGKGIAVSIGFQPTQRARGQVRDLVAEMPELKPYCQAAGLEDTATLCCYTKWELYELSAVGVPSNRAALQHLAAKLAGGAELDGPELEPLRAWMARHAKGLIDEAVGLAKTEMEMTFRKELDELIASLPDQADFEPPADADPRTGARRPAAAGVDKSAIAGQTAELVAACRHLAGATKRNH
jgi:hypothetical protein